MARFVRDAPVAACPEHSRAIRAILASVPIHLREQREWRAEYGANFQFIVFSSKTLEVLWALAYATEVLYSKHAGGRLADEPRTTDLTLDPETHAAMELLVWATRSWLEDDMRDWPLELPAPTEARVHGSHLHVADEVSLVAAAFILLHELGHHEQAGAAGAIQSQLEAEVDADARAVSRLLSGVDPASPEFHKRALGVVVALTAMTLSDATRGAPSETHPPAWDRMESVLTRYVQDPGHLLWAFTAVVLKLFLDNGGVSVAAGPFSDFKEASLVYLAALRDAGWGEDVDPGE